MRTGWGEKGREFDAHVRRRNDVLPLVVRSAWYAINQNDNSRALCWSSLFGRGNVSTG